MAIRWQPSGIGMSALVSFIIQNFKPSFLEAFFFKKYSNVFLRYRQLPLLWILLLV